MREVNKEKILCNLIKLIFNIKISRCQFFQINNLINYLRIHGNTYKFYSNIVI